uniref:GPI inositol-deacylase n=1 Tax=Setaria digitata TaxID=48799 RepID=A0A915PGB3_9BILA
MDPYLRFFEPPQHFQIPKSSTLHLISISSLQHAPTDRSAFDAGCTAFPWTPPSGFPEDQITARRSAACQFGVSHSSSRTLFAGLKCRRDGKIQDAVEAVTMLNQNKHTKMAVEYLERTKADIELCHLNTEARFRLALRGSLLCRRTATTSAAKPTESVGMLEDAIKRLVIDDEWKKTVEWLIPHMHDEDDPSSYKYFLKRRRSQDLRLNHFLSQLLLKTETGFGKELINQDVLKLLMGLCNHYRRANRNIYLNTLKILANIVMQNEYCATAVANSEWLPVLADMTTSHIFEEMLMAEKICNNGLSVFDSTRKPLKTNIYELFRPDDDESPVVDLVLIHGIRGSVFWTWRERDTPSKALRTRCWPRAWLPQDIPVPIRILAIDYLSSLIHFAGVVETLNTRAERFSVELKTAGVGDRPILFICHSMGGLLAKRILLDYPEIRRNTMGILFMATPHRGSPYAMYAPLGVRPSDDVRLLHQQSVINRQLHQDFLKIIDTVPVISSVAETEKAPLIMRQKGILVPPESAYLERGAFYHINDVGLSTV